MIVSHDRYLIDKLTDQLFIFEDQGNIRIYNGNYADYKTEQLELARIEKDNSKNIDKPLSQPEKKETEKKKLSYKELREYESLESEIQELENSITEKTAMLQQVSDHEKITSIALEIQNLQKDLDSKSERWIVLAEQI